MKKILLITFLIVSSGCSHTSDNKADTNSQKSASETATKGVKPRYIDFNAIQAGAVTPESQGLHKCDIHQPHRPDCYYEPDLAVKNAYFNYKDVPNTNEVPNYSSPSSSVSNNSSLKDIKSLQADKIDASPQTNTLNNSQSLNNLKDTKSNNLPSTKLKSVENIKDMSELNDDGYTLEIPDDGKEEVKSPKSINSENNKLVNSPNETSKNIKAN